MQPIQEKIDAIVHAVEQAVNNKFEMVDWSFEDRFVSFEPDGTGQVHTFKFTNDDLRCSLGNMPDVEDAFEVDGTVYATCLYTRKDDIDKTFDISAKDYVEANGFHQSGLTEQLVRDMAAEALESFKDRELGRFFAKAQRLGVTGDLFASIVAKAQSLAA